MRTYLLSVLYIFRLICLPRFQKHKRLIINNIARILPGNILRVWLSIPCGLLPRSARRALGGGPSEKTPRLSQAAGYIGSHPLRAVASLCSASPWGGAFRENAPPASGGGVYFFVSPAQASLAGGQKNTRHFCAGRFLWVEDGVRTHDL